MTAHRIREVQGENEMCCPVGWDDTGETIAIPDCLKTVRGGLSWRWWVAFAFLCNNNMHHHHHLMNCQCFPPIEVNATSINFRFSLLVNLRSRTEMRFHFNSWNCASCVNGERKERVGWVSRFWLCIAKIDIWLIYVVQRAVGKDFSISSWPHLYVEAFVEM